MKNKVSIPIYDGMELRMTVENGFLIAEYSEEEDSNIGDVKRIQEHPIGSIFDQNGKYYLVCDDDKGDGCKECCFFVKNICQYKMKCYSSIREDSRSVVYQEIKDGDILRKSDGTEFIFKSADSDGVKFHALCYLNDNTAVLIGSPSFGNVPNSGITNLNFGDKCTIIEKLRINGKDWDADNRTIIDYVEPIKEGDLCILWDDYKYDAIITIVTDVSLDNSSLPYTTNTECYRNAIKLISLEQYQQFIKQ